MSELHFKTYTARNKNKGRSWFAQSFIISNLADEKLILDLDVIGLRAILNINFI